MSYYHFRHTRKINGDTVGLYTNDLTKLITVDDATANYITLKGGLGTGKWLKLLANDTDAYPLIRMEGLGHIINSININKRFWINYESTESASISHAGHLRLVETTTPTAATDYGVIYCKNDNKLYFQDGAGVEHTLAFV